jgi:RNA polymerase sigma-70 factor (ECF subfamily)
MLYQEFYGYGMSICLRYANSRDEAVHILNEGFLKVFTSINKFDVNKPFKPWLRKIIINTAIDHYHQKKQQIQTEEIQSAHDESGSENILSGISYQELLEMLQRVSPGYRTVFNLYVIEGYNHEEIANLLNISTGTSKSNLFKARGQLRKILTNFFLT